MHAYLDHAGVLAFAHRGDHESGPENTLPAFAGAVALGFNYLETDAHCMMLMPKTSGQSELTDILKIQSGAAGGGGGGGGGAHQHPKH